jgi:hypothetical protein
VGLGLAVALGGCTKTLAARTSQPNPLAAPNETLRESARVVIVTGDKDLYVPREAAGLGSTALLSNQRYRLYNVAAFTVVSRDRLRFHVQLEHKWKEYVDVRQWRAVLVDDRGNRYQPVDIDHQRHRHLVTMWDYEVRTARRNRYGDIVGINNDGHKDRRTLGSLSVFRGLGDYVFYSRDIFNKSVKSMTLVLKRRGMRLEFRWDFVTEGALARAGASGAGGQQSQNRGRAGLRGASRRDSTGRELR